MKKKIFLILTVITVLFLVSCNGKELPKNYDKEKMESISIEVIEDINNNKYDGAYEKYCRKDFKSPEIEGKIKNAVKEIQSEKGPFERFERAKFVGSKNPEDKSKRMGVAIVNCKHEKKDVIYTISFNENMEIIGLYLK